MLKVAGSIPKLTDKWSYQSVASPHEIRLRQEKEFGQWGPMVASTPEAPHCPGNGVRKVVVWAAGWGALTP